MARRIDRNAIREAKRNPHLVLRLRKRQQATRDRKVYCDPWMPSGWEPYDGQLRLPL